MGICQSRDHRLNQNVNKPFQPGSRYHPSFLEKHESVILEKIGIAKSLLEHAKDEENVLGRPFKFDRSEMDSPLSHYFINSSHNSYLEGNQLTGLSSGEAVRDILLHGGRVIELDCYDGPKGEPIVTHGGTVCKPTLLRNCLMAIKESGFERSEYPVIVTFENHVNVEQRGVMGDMLEEIFGDILYRPESNINSEWPSPNQLKGKVVVRDKLLHKQDSKKSKSGKESKFLSSITESKKEKKVAAAAVLTTSKTLSPSMHEVLMDNEDNEEDDEDYYEDEAAETLAPGSVADKLKKLVLIGNVKFHGYEEAKKWDGVKSCSISEKKVEKMIKKAMASEAEYKELVQFTKKHLLRCYPGGLRLLSDNADPNMAWSVGTSIVALNFQGKDRAIFMNRGKFADNGGSGYIKKPQFLLDGKKTGASAKTLTFTILAGSGWEAFKNADIVGAPDTYVKVSICGKNGSSQQTKVFSEARVGPNAQPHWNEKITLESKCPELDLVLFEVFDQDPDADDLLGYYCCSVLNVQKGLKHVPLFDVHGHHCMYTGKKRPEIHGECASILVDVE
jgi:phosphatidylinositol phospholipase C, delta